ncbi:MAG: hypothetical protein R8J94_13570 [Acidimicrobiia bacterium]|nr:hypothetical protein [Acidimicrobiia bacterium]
MIDHSALAVELYEAERSTVPIRFLTERYPGLEWHDARKIARATDALRRSEGETQVGWKLGWTSEAMRTALGIDRPNWGTLWARQQMDSSTTFSAFIHPKIEPELVWRCPQNIDGAPSADELRELGGQWTLGIEVVDPRFPSFDFDALDNTADNSSSAAIAIGSFQNTTALPELESLQVELSDGRETRHGLGSQAMGSPWEAIAWLVRSLAEEGDSIQADEIVFTGGITAPFDVVRGHRYSMSAEGFSTVNLTFE